MRRLHLLGLVVVVAAVSGCSDSAAEKDRKQAEQTATAYAATSTDQIWLDVLASYQGLTSLHMRGSTVEGETNVGVDLSLDTDGRCTGTMQLGEGTFNVLSDGQQFWMRGDAAGWDALAGDGSGEVFAGKWVTGLGDDGMQEICDLSSFVEQMDTQFGGAQDTEANANLPDDKVVGTAMVDSRPAVTVQSTDTADLTPITVQVAASEPHYLLQMTSRTLGAMVFTDQNKPLEITAPAAADVVDLSTSS